MKIYLLLKSMTFGILFFMFFLVTFVDAGHVLSDPVKHLECILKIRTAPDCPVDGGWTQWLEWEDCQGQCGQVGHQIRRRLCTNPTPLYDGYDCRGKHEEIRSCQILGCVPEDYEKLIRGDPLRSAQYELIKAVHERFPALAMKCLENSCSYETVKNVLHSGASDYWISLHCVKHNVGCPVHGGWTSWSRWSECSAICGSGKKFRQRSCTNPRPTALDLDCDGARLEQEDCTGTACAEHIDGVWFVWSPWSECSERCGPGIERRERKCQSQRTKREIITTSYGHDRLNRTLREVAKQMVQAVDAENRCSGPSWEIDKCENKECDWNGGWSAWEEWTPCSASCDLGFQSRSRSCGSPPMRGNGKQCVGETTEIRRCYMQPCSVKPHMLAMFNGESQLVFPATDQPKMLLHIYLRFLPLQPNAKLIYRHATGCVTAHRDIATLNLEGGYLVWHALVKGCKATTYSEDKLEINKWHEVLLTITGLKITMRIDDSMNPLVAYFNYVPVNPNLDHQMVVGECFHGHIQHLNINFRPLSFQQNPAQDNEVGYVPSASANMLYGTLESETEEGFRHFADNELIVASCPQNRDHWKVEMAVKVETINGLLLLLPADDDLDYTEVVLELGRVKLREHNGDLHSEVLSNRKFAVGDWVYVVVNRGGVHREGNFSDSPCDVGMSVNGDDRIALASTACQGEGDSIACNGHMFIGSAPLSHQITGKRMSSQEEEQEEEEKDFMPLSGFLGFLAIDGKARDVEALPSAGKGGQVLSSHSISTADHYIDMPMSLGEQVNLSCYYDHIEPQAESHNSALWLLLDTAIDDTTNQSQQGSKIVQYNTNDDGMVATLSIATYPSHESVEGFYLCWVEKDGEEAKVLIAYGVAIVGKTLGGVLGILIYSYGTLAALLALVFLGLHYCMRHRSKSSNNTRNRKPQNARRETTSSESSNEHEKNEFQTNVQYTALRMEVTANYRPTDLGSEDEYNLPQCDGQSHGDGAHNCDRCQGDIKYDDDEQKCQHEQHNISNAGHGDAMQDPMFALLSGKSCQDSKDEERVPQENLSDHTLWTSPTSKTYTSNSSSQPSLPPIPTNNNKTSPTPYLTSIAQSEESESETSSSHKSSMSTSFMSAIINDEDGFLQLQQPMCRESLGCEQVFHSCLSPTINRPMIESQCYHSVPLITKPVTKSKHGEEISHSLDTSLPMRFETRRLTTESRQIKEAYDSELKSKPSIKLESKPCISAPHTQYQSSPLLNRDTYGARRTEQTFQGQSSSNNKPMYRNSYCKDGFQDRCQSTAPKSSPLFDRQRQEQLHQNQNQASVAENKTKVGKWHSQHICSNQYLHASPANKPTLNHRHNEQVYRSQWQPAVAHANKAYNHNCKPVLPSNKDLFNITQQFQDKPAHPFYRHKYGASCSEDEFQGHRPKLDNTFIQQQCNNLSATSSYQSQSCDCSVCCVERKPKQGARVQLSPLAEFDRLIREDDAHNQEMFGTHKTQTDHRNIDNHYRTISEHFLDLNAVGRDAQYNAPGYTSKYVLE